MAIFSCALWRPVQNRGGAMSRNMGLILHHAVANGSLYNHFNSPGSGVSAHFWVSKSGLIEQYVDTNVVAWHAMQLNDRYCGVETEGCAQPPHAEPMTEAMINALATLYREGNQLHGWPNRLANGDGQDGFGFHRMAVPTACPCDVRLEKRQEILNRAFGDDDMPLSDADKKWIKDTINLELRTLFGPGAECYNRGIQFTSASINQNAGNFVKWAKEGAQQAQD